MGEFLATFGFYVVFAAYFALFAGVPALLYRRSVRRELFALAARQLGLDLGLRGRGIATRTLSGEIDGFAVTVEEYDTGRFRNGLRLVVDGSGRRAGRLPASVRVAEAPRRHGPGPAVPEGRVLTGDPAFDGIVLLGGEEAVALALLDADARRDLTRFLLRNAGARLEEASVRLDLPRGAGAEALVGLVREAVDLAQGLVIEEEAVPARLAHLARTDPLGPVRRRALEALAGSFPASPATAASLREALGDRDEVVRGTAAVALGGELPEVLRRMLERPREAESRAAAWALASLPGRFPAARVSVLARAAARDRRSEVRAAALRALAALGDEAAESAALAALASPEEALALAAVEALGTAGTVAAVPRLRERIEGRPFEFALRRAVEEAVERIRARLPGAARGQVSLAADAGVGGRVSLAGAGDGAGSVSLAADAGVPPVGHAGAPAPRPAVGVE